MLQFIRERTQGVVVWVIIGVIIAAFALVGVSSYLGDDSQSYIAQVNDTKISLREYQSAYQQERAFRQRIFGDNISPALLKESVLQRVALDRLISTELVIQASTEAGFRVTDVQLGTQIRSMREFQGDGQFDQVRYAQLLNSQGLSQEGFEHNVRRDILARQMMDGLVDSALLTRHETDQLLRLRKQQRQFAYMVLEVADQFDNVSVTDEAVQQFYDELSSEFFTDEQLSIEYLELRPDSIDAQIEADEQQLRAMYDEQLAEFSAGEERRASHILIKAEDESDSARQAAQAQAQELVEQLRQGAEFAALAEAHSSDPGSARQGGDLGFFGRGMMVAAFEAKAFSMSEGEISEPVQTPYGYHVIKLTGINAGETQSFAAVRDELLERFRQEKAEEQFFELVDLLTNLTFEAPDTLTVAADELGLTIKTSAPFQRHAGVGIASEERVRDVAFSDDVLEARNNSEVLTLGENHVLVLRIKERRPSARQSLDEVRAEVVERLRRKLAGEQQRERGEAIIALLKDGAEGVTLAQAQGSEWNSSGFIDRFDKDTDDEVLKQVFSMSRPGEDQPVTVGASLSNGDYVVATVYAVRDGNPSEVDDEQRQEIADERQRNLGQHVTARLLDSLKSRATVVEFLDQI